MRYPRWGGRRNAVRMEKAEAKKMLENAQTPQRRVHAVLGGILVALCLFCNFKTIAPFFRGFECQAYGTTFWMLISPLAQWLALPASYE